MEFTDKINSSDIINTSSLETPKISKTPPKLTPKIKTLEYSPSESKKYDDDIYKEKYTRQIASLGEKTSSQISNLKIGILFLKTVGWEAAKSLVLMGIHTLYIYDFDRATQEHTTLNLSIPDKPDKKTTIAEYTLIKLRSLNPMVNLKIANDISFFENVDVVILTDFPGFRPLPEIIDILESMKKPHILVQSSGFCGLLYNNFFNHTVNDINGEKPLMTNAKIIPKSEFIETSDIYETSEDINYLIEGFEGINKGQLFVNGVYEKDIEISNNRFTLPIEYFDKTILIKEIKNSETIEFKPLSEVFEIDNFYKNIENLEIINRKKALNNYFMFFKHKYHRLDVPFESFTELLPYNFSLYPIASLMGNLAASEALKITGFLTPIQNGLIFDFIELDKGNESRVFSGKWKHIQNLLDAETLDKIRNANIFMIGCGALGCEHAKNLTMLNVSTSRTSRFTITDMDTISISNLSRQYFFEEKDIGKLKSLVIKEKIDELGVKTHLTALNKAVSKENEKIFNRRFWELNDYIFNALDNIQARLYVDQKCILYKKPLFESGTLGTKLNVQTIIPFKTQTYGEIEDPPQKEIPFCTIRNFPYLPEHCVEWALSTYQELFEVEIKDLIQILDNSTEFLTKINTIGNSNIIKSKYLHLIDLLNVIKSNPDEIKNNMNKLLINRFYEYFYYPIQVLQHSFPKEMKDENDILFWSGNRNYPELPELSFIPVLFNYYKKIFGSKLESYGIFNDKVFKMEFNKFLRTKLISKVDLEDLKKNKTIDCDSELDITDLLIEINRLLEIKELYIEEMEFEKSVKKEKINIIYFDKDDWKSGCLDMLYELTKLRMETYHIPLISKLEIVSLAGRIIPALATTTGITSALVVIEWLRHIILGKGHMDWNFNLGNNLYLSYNSNSPGCMYDKMMDKAYNMEIRTIPDEYSIWTNIKINICKLTLNTVKDLEEYIKDEYDDFEYDIMSFIDGNDIINNGIPSVKSKLLKSLWTENKKDFEDYILLDIIAFSKDGIPVRFPKLILEFME